MHCPQYKLLLNIATNYGYIQNMSLNLGDRDQFIPKV